MTGTEFGFFVAALVFGGLFVAFFVQNMNLRERLANQEAATRTEERLKMFADERLRTITASRDEWRDLACKSVEDLNRKNALLEKAYEQVGRAKEMLSGMSDNEAARLRRLFERMRHFNPHYVHGEWKKTECCPCVSFIQKEYVDAALGKDA